MNLLDRFLSGVENISKGDFSHLEKAAEATGKQFTSGVENISRGDFSQVPKNLDILQGGLDVAGFDPGVAGMGADASNALISALRGNLGESSLYAASLIPFVDVVTKPLTSAKKIARLEKKLDKLKNMKKQTKEVKSKIKKTEKDISKTKYEIKSEKQGTKDNIKETLQDKFGKRKGRKVYNKIKEDPSLHNSLLKTLGLKKGPVRAVRDKFGNLVDWTGLPKASKYVRDSKVGKAWDYISPSRYGNKGTYLAGLLGAGAINQMALHGERGLYDYDSAELNPIVQGLFSPLVGMTQPFGYDPLGYRAGIERYHEGKGAPSKGVQYKEQRQTESTPNIPEGAINMYQRLREMQDSDTFNFDDDNYWDKLDSLESNYPGIGNYER